MTRSSFLMILIALTIMTGCSFGPITIDPNEASWKRPDFKSSNMNARLLYFIPGKFKYPLDIEIDKIRASEMPVEVRLVEGTRENEKDAKRIDDTYADIFSEKFGEREPELFKRIKAAPHGVTVFYESTDKNSLLYLRSVIAGVKNLVDNGGLAVYDMLGYRWFTPSEWKSEIFDVDRPRIDDQMVIVAHEEDSNSQLCKVRTQGLLKFARPDICVRNVAKAEMNSVERFLKNLGEAQMKGRVVEDGAELKFGDQSRKLKVKLIDGREDDLFNNYYLETSLR